MPSQDQVIEDVYAREVVMARVGHLIRRKQQEIERIARILRLTASFEGVAAPVPGVITRIVLIGPYARRTWYEDKASLYFSDYAFWVVVNQDRKSVVVGKGVAVRVERGGRRLINKKKKENYALNLQ